MGEIVNLRMARKGKARTESEAAATANRAKFGASKPEKTLTALRLKSDGKHLDAHKRETPEKP